MNHLCYQVFDGDGLPVWGAQAPNRADALRAWWAIDNDGTVPAFTVGDRPEWRSAQGMGWRVRPVMIASRASLRHREGVERG